MLSACPVCRAENAGATCRRCKADLSMLLALDEQREALLASARVAYNQQRVAEACRLAHSANEYRQDAESLRLLAMMQLLQGDFGEAWRAYRVLNPHV